MEEKACVVRCVKEFQREVETSIRSNVSLAELASMLEVTSTFLQTSEI